ncbi:hypothetical protein QVM55_12645 [Pseudomonas monteilii]|uniref:hypothetical protein n=1 Tax=Pseudomonas TaxID=286 RepID=UPI000D73D7F2|nr:MULTISPECIES: hypothetical protein [unclassified Pseudomonas]MBC3480315.1 hypothetical protein [Pseudomonas sp. SWRI77]MDE4538036.1 hypothetical protein [Pseudomonas sp. ITEM 17296]PWY39044.1 hypothetical protein DK184_24995 [Pseudomonas sp. RW405]
MRYNLSDSMIKVGMTLDEVTEIVGEEALGGWGKRGLMGRPERQKSFYFMDQTKWCVVWFDDSDVVVAKTTMDIR